jgi:glycosyltransferase involved in cell wall biosynthesis
MRLASFWLSFAGAAWILVGYPLSLLLARARPWTIEPIEPPASVILPTYREYEALPKKLRNVAALNYPAAKLEVIVVSDGDPELARIAREALPAATVIELAQRSGKPAALNAALERATGQIIVVTDAHSPLEPGVLRAAVQHFADPEIGAVSGHWAERGSAYARYEDLLRRGETRSGSVASVFGAFIAVRRELLDRFPPDVVNDDLWLLCHTVRQGGRVIYEPRIVSREDRLGSDDELERRTRIGAGRALLLRELHGLPPSFALRLLSHKFGRLLLPFFLLGMLGGSLSLVRRRAFYRDIAAAQIVFYVLGAADFPVARQFLIGNIASARGVLRAAKGAQGTQWSGVRK